MFTSRAEYRLSLREDNADLRLTEIGRKLGLVNEERWQAFSSKAALIKTKTDELKAINISPTKLKSKGLVPPSKKNINALDLLKRPDFSYEDVISMGLIEDFGDGLYPELVTQIKQQLKIQAGYAGYIERQKKEISRQQKKMSTKIPANFSFSIVNGLSNEVREKLERVKPKDIGQASRISGVTPAAISLLLVYLKKNYKKSA